MKARLESAFRRTLDAIGIDRCLRDQVSCDPGGLSIPNGTLPLGGVGRVEVIAFGKAAYVMCRSFLDVLAPGLQDGVVPAGVIAAPATPAGDRLPGFDVFAGGHPYPNDDSFRAAERVLSRLESLEATDLVVFLISGGGSAILEKPLVEGASLADWETLNRVLVGCGAGIVDINVVRKHFSAVKGGRLAAVASPARQLTLYVSDVPEGMPSAVASGPTMPDESTWEDCRTAVDRHGIDGSLPAIVRDAWAAGDLPETPKPDDELFALCRWHELMGSGVAVDRFADELRGEGWQVVVDLTVDEWPVEKARDRLLDRLAAAHEQDPTRPAVVVTGGELSSPVTGPGTGGRNQAFVLSCAEAIAGRNIAVLSAGTDGIDGSSDAAGALADGTTIGRGDDLGLDAEEFRIRCDSGAYFAALGDAITTGPTGNNVRDLRALVIW